VVNRELTKASRTVKIVNVCGKEEAVVWVFCYCKRFFEVV
jgi:hypothetical protein